MVEPVRFNGMLVARYQEKIVAIAAENRPFLIPTFRHAAMLHGVLTEAGVLYDHVDTIEDGEAFVGEATRGCLSYTIEQGHGGDVLCIRIDMTVA